MKITYNGKTYTYDEWRQEIAREAEAGEKWCRDCVYYSEAEFLSWTEGCCDIYGTLDLVFTIEPNDIADKCPDYVQKQEKRWFEQLIF